MQKNATRPVLTVYSAWLANVRQTSAEQRLIQTLFSKDGTSVSFDTISFATFKALPERDTGQE